MKLILTNDVENLGQVGEIVTVRPGYGRNFLIPRGLAAVATAQSKAAIEHQKKVLEKKRLQLLTEARALGAKIEKTSVTVSKPVGEDEKIFGTVTTSELSELLLAEGISIDKKQIRLLDEVKKVGVYAASIKLHSEVEAKFKVWVVAQ